MKNTFLFEEQFATPEDYYKSFLVLRKLNEKINLSKFYFDIPPLNELVEFCDEHMLEITGAEFQKCTYKGGNKVSQADMSKIIKDKLGIDSDGRIYSYSIADNKLNMAASIICIKVPDRPEGCITMTEPEFNQFLYSEGLEYYNAAIEDPKSDRNNTSGKKPEYKTEIVLADMFFSASKVVVTQIKDNKWEYIDYVEKPEGASSNQWIISSTEIGKYQDQHLEISPVIKAGPEAMAEAFNFTGKELQKIKSFEVSINSHMMYGQLEAMEEYVPDGLCLNCHGNDITRGDMVSCYNCGSDKLVFFDENFPWEDNMFEKLRSFSKILWKPDK